jgi:glyoxylase-like metal-dependent hydrolase (beta-lactamase superfamily II)
MSRRMLIALCLCKVLLGLTAFAQAPTESASQKSYVQARQTLEAGIKAVGGLEALQSVTDITREMTGARSDQGQGLQPVPVAQSSKPPVTNPYTKATSIRDLRGQRVMEYRETSQVGGKPFKYRRLLSGNSIFFVNYTAGVMEQNTPPNPAVARAAALRDYPESLLLRAWNSPQTLRSLGEAQYAGRTQQVISFADIDGAQVALYFDAQTKLLTKREMLSDDPVLGVIAIETVFSDWRPAGKLTLPYRCTDKVGGSVFIDMQARSITLNTQPPDSTFAPPEGMPVHKPEPFAVRPLAQDVYLIRGGYNGLFVVFNDHVLVIEAGGGPGYTQNCINEIKKVAPNKPIRYLVATHFHFDHVGGVRSYIAEGTTIVTTPTAKTVIERSANATLLRPDALARNPRQPVIETITDKQVFEDGAHKVELYHFASPHAAEMIVAYLPKEKLLFEADLLDLDTPENGVAMAGADTVDLLERIARWGLQVEKIIPAHGRLGTLDDLRRAVAGWTANR